MRGVLLYQAAEIYGRWWEVLAKKYSVHVICCHIFVFSWSHVLVCVCDVLDTARCCCALKRKRNQSEDVVGVDGVDGDKEVQSSQCRKTRSMTTKLNT
eukprot:TRINITY_DN5691_c0_g1_i2.p2 TRINITY_DN5691_c0_g1~~TRINITY_DN5691_c0_g1_i2.p2  ORF type:complete len:98 (-),score=7.26 TRINITY_DN5691_c0_g1_i2:140-433(-)